MILASLERYHSDYQLFSEPYRDFLSLLACLGGSMSGNIFLHALRPATYWNERGAFIFETPDGLLDFLISLNILSGIIRAVQAVSIVDLKILSIRANAALSL